MRYEANLYMSHANEMLQVAEQSLAQGFHSPLSTEPTMLCSMLPTLCCLFASYRGGSIVELLPHSANTLSNQERLRPSIAGSMVNLWMTETVLTMTSK